MGAPLGVSSGMLPQENLKKIVGSGTKERDKETETLKWRGWWRILSLFPLYPSIKDRGATTFSKLGSNSLV